MKYFFLFLGLIYMSIRLRAQSAPEGEVNGRGWSFVPDSSFKGSGLSGWQSVGGAEWQAGDGKLSGKVTSEGAAGLLVLNRSFEDVGIHTLFTCTAGCEAGLLFRMQRTAAGISGILVSVTEGEVASWNISFDLRGRELQRQKLRRAGSIVRMAPPPDPAARPEDTARPANRSRPPAAALNLPLQRPSTAFRAGEWNQLEVFLDLNIIRSFLNDGGETAGGATPSTGGYGPVALYAAGKGEVAFRDFGYKDLALRFTPMETSSSRFHTQRISDMYYSWGAASADFNRDGYADLVAGPYLYYGPGFTHYREIFPGVPYNPSKDFAETNCQYAYDFNGDGWPDVLTGPPRAQLYINPKGASRRWDKYEVVPSIQSEITVFTDIDEDGRPELIYGANGTLQYAAPYPAEPLKPFITRIISERGYALAHGIGTGDINGDGHKDIVNPNGWWENPAPHDSGKLWLYHPVAFARYGHRSGGVGGSVMGVYDVNGDGMNDVVTSLNAHGFGLAWYEQKQDAGKGISFVRHMICDDYSAANAGNISFSEPHGSAFADVDGDGITDFIVGKRYWSHLDNYFDPDPYGPPVLYWYRTVRARTAPGGARFVPQLIHNRSGAGSDVLAVDLNKDGAVDIVTSTDRGTFIFWNTPGRGRKKMARK